jgi:hypothetical protein
MSRESKEKAPPPRRDGAVVRRKLGDYLAFFCFC